MSWAAAAMRFLTVAVVLPNFSVLLDYLSHSGYCLLGLLLFFITCMTMGASTCVLGYLFVAQM